MKSVTKQKTCHLSSGSTKGYPGVYTVQCKESPNSAASCKYKVTTAFLNRGYGHHFNNLFLLGVVQDLERTDLKGFR